MNDRSLRSKFAGVLLPTTTNFHTDGTLDPQSFRSNLKCWLTAPIKGFVLLGSTGERVHLDEREYLELIEVAREDIPKDRVLVVGAGQQSTIGTIKEIRAAANAGAEAVLVITPNYYRSAITQETLRDFYSAIADASTVPILLYSMPALTGIKIEPETIASLSEHPNVIGVKDSSNDMTGFRNTLDMCPTEFAVMTGNGTVFLDALEAGATGAILAVGCVVPEVCIEVLGLYKAGELEKAEALQATLTPFAAAVTTRFGVAGLKAAMDFAGYIGGTVRAPLSAPSEEAKTEIAQLLEQLREALLNVTSGQCRTLNY